MRLHFRRLIYAQDVVRVKIRIHEPTLTHLKSANPSMRQFIDRCALDLLHCAAWIDDMAAIGYNDDLLHVQLSTPADGDCCASRCNRAVAFNHSNAHAFALFQVCAVAGFFLERFKYTLPVVLASRHFNAPVERVPATGERHFVYERFNNEASLVCARTAMRRAWHMRVKIVSLMVTQRYVIWHVVNAVIGGRRPNPIHLVDGVPERTRVYRFRQAIGAQRSRHARSRHRTLLVLRNVFLTAPQDLDRALETL